MVNLRSLSEATILFAPDIERETRPAESITDRLPYDLNSFKTHR